MKARSLAASLSYRVATRRHCLILLKNRSIKLARAVQIRAKADRFFAIPLGGILAQGWQRFERTKTPRPTAVQGRSSHRFSSG